MIVALAIRTNTLPDEWARQEPQDIETALQILEDLAREAKR